MDARGVRNALTNAKFIRLLYRCGDGAEDFRKIVETNSGFGALTN